MQCEEFESRINQLLDEREPPRADARVADHARECVACADVLASYGQVLDIVGSAVPLEMDANPTAQIIAQVQLAARRRRRLWTTLVPLAVAASLLIALVPLIKMRLDRRDVEVVNLQTPAPVTPVVSPREVDPAGAGSPQPPLPTDDRQGVDIVRMAIEVNEALAGLTDRLSKTPTDDPSPQPAPDVAPNASPEGREWLRNINDRLKPLADTMAAALSAMGRTLPNTAGEESPSS